MGSRMLDWLNDRVGYRRPLQWYRQRLLPEGPSWGRTTAACVLWLFLIESVTGLLLLTSYSPSMNSAWASVHYIDQMTAGRFIRGLHYFGGQGLIILFIVHTIRVLLSAAYRPPREIVWVTGLLLIPLLTVWAVTGNPLSGTQKGLAQIEVEGNIVGSTPLIGPIAQRVLIGGDEVGNLTLTHLHSLHVALLPLLVGCLLLLHLHQVFRHATYPPAGTTATDPKSVPYWPEQSWRNLIAFSLVFGAIVFLALRYGAPHDVPADPELHHIPRPEWYFLFLFELRRYFTGQYEFIATVVIPGAVLLLLLIVPLLDGILGRRASLFVRSTLVVAGLGAWGTLTWISLARDARDADLQETRQHERELAARARLLAGQGISVRGANQLLRNDPKTQGPKLFSQHCAGCHSHTDHDGQGIVCQEPSAPNLFGIGSRQWVTDILTPEKFSSPRYFGHTAFSESDMVESGVTDHLEAEQVAQVVAALSAEAGLTRQAPEDRRDAAVIAAGRELIQDDSDGCAGCHKFHDSGELGSAPELTGYSSRPWLIAFISDPTHERFYPDTNDRMPAFAPDAQPASNHLLSAADLAILADWLRRDWYETPVSNDTKDANQ